jgi:hypothetical protein
MYMPKPTKAENLVRRYLDSIYSHKKVDSLTFGELATIDDSYLIKNTTDDIPDSVLKQMSDSDKVTRQKWIKHTISNNKGYDIVCVYKINNVPHTNLFKIDTTFNKVMFMVDVHNYGFKK